MNGSTKLDSNLIKTFRETTGENRVQHAFLHNNQYTTCDSNFAFHALCTSGVCEKPRTQVANSFLNCDLQVRIESRRPIYPVIDIIDYSSNILFMLYTRALCQKPHFKAATNVKKSILSSKRIQHGCVTLK